MDLHVIKKYFNDTENQPTQKPKPHRIGLLLILFNMPILLGGTDSLIVVFLYPTLDRL
jgi:hypothetical protein